MRAHQRDLARELARAAASAPDDDDKRRRRLAPGRRSRLEDVVGPVRHRASGLALPDPLRAKFERSLGVDLGGVRLHVDGVSADTASTLGATAFALGHDIHFARGAYDPSSPAGEELIAHEVAHAVQQRDASGSPAIEVSSPGDPCEREADHAAPAMTRGEPFAIGERARGVVARMRWQEVEDDLDKIGRLDPDTHQVEPPSPDGLAWVLMHLGRPIGDVVARYNYTIAAQRIEERNADICARIRLSGFDADEGLALAKSFGCAAAVIQDSDGGAVYVVDDFSYRHPPTCVPGVVKLLSNEGVVFEPNAPIGTSDPSAMRSTSDDASLHSQADPFAAYNKLDVHLGHQWSIATFGAALRDTALVLLARSEHEATVKRQEYMLEEGLGGNFGIDEDEIANIRSTAAELAAIDRKIAGIDMQLFSDEYGAHRKELQARRDAEEEGRRVVQLRYPLLERFRETALGMQRGPAALDSIASMSDAELMHRLGGATRGVLDDIAETRANILAGKLELWTVPNLVEATLAGLAIDDPQQVKTIRDHAAQAQRVQADMQTLLVTINIALGIAATIVGGPVGAACAIGALGAGTMSALHATDQFLVKKSAANTNLDPSHGIVRPDNVPGAEELVAAWALVLLDGAAAIKAVASIGKTADSIETAAEVVARDNAQRLEIDAKVLADQLKAAAKKAGVDARFAEVGAAGGTATRGGTRASGWASDDFRSMAQGAADSDPAHGYADVYTRGYADANSTPSSAFRLPDGRRVVDVGTGTAAQTSAANTVAVTRHVNGCTAVAMKARGPTGELIDLSHIMRDDAAGPMTRIAEDSRQLVQRAQAADLQLVISVDKGAIDGGKMPIDPAQVEAQLSAALGDPPGLSIYVDVVADTRTSSGADNVMRDLLVDSQGVTIRYRSDTLAPATRPWRK